MGGGLIDSVFSKPALDEAFSGVLEAMANAQRAHIRDPFTHKQKILKLRESREIVVQSIIDRQKAEGTLRFTRFVTRIPKKPGGKLERPISLFSVEERIVLRAVLNVIWPYLETVIIPSVSYCTFRKGGLHPSRGIRSAVALIGAERWTRNPYIFETDIKAFFDCIRREKLLAQASLLLCDETLNDLLRAILFADVQIDSRFEQDKLEFECGIGVPQGAALSPLLACTYLSPFDNHMNEGGFQMLRYVDDLVVVGSHVECQRAEIECRTVLRNEYGLEVHPNIAKTKHVSPQECLIFLGHDIFPDGTLRPSTKRRRAVAEHVYRTICGHKGDFGYVHGLPRANQNEIVDHLSSYLLGYFSNMEHCSWTAGDYAEVAGYITSALKSRGLQPNRLSRGLRAATNKWPPAFIDALP